MDLSFSLYHSFAVFDLFPDFVGVPDLKEHSFGLWINLLSFRSEALEMGVVYF
jgi:hypothetical protein